MKTVLTFVMAGMLLGAVVASIVVPPALAWYTAPGGLPKGTQIQALVEIPEVIRYATGRLLRGQMIGGGIGGVLGLVSGVLMMRRSGVRAPVVPVPAPTRTD